MSKGIGFIGGGNMAAGIIGGLIKRRVFLPENIYVKEAVTKREYELKRVRDKGIYIGRVNISFILVFLITMFITTVLELLGSYFMEFLMGDWLWDYSNYFCNFEGRIALWSSVKFGIGGLIIIYFIEPLINICIKKADKRAINVFSLILAIIFLIDLSFRPFLGSNFLGK